MTNLEKNFCPNYLWRTLVTQALARKNFLQICNGDLDRLAPQKKKKNNNRSNNMHFMNKPLPLAHMKKSRLRNQFLKTRFEVSRINFLSNTIIL